MNSNRLNILGIPVDAYRSIEEALKNIEVGMNGVGAKTIFSINPEKIMRARKDFELVAALCSSDYLIADGVGIVLASKVIHKKRISRVAGVDLMELLLHIAEERRFRVYIFGGKPRIYSKAIEEIKKRFPSLNIAGGSHGYVHQDRYQALIEDINGAQPDILFVGLGSPKQEKWISRYKNRLKVKLCMGIGGSLDVIAGSIPRAPHVFRTLGLEWFYRLIREPHRFRRQLALPQFFFELLKEKSF